MPAVVRVLADDQVIQDNLSSLFEFQSAVGGFIEIVQFPIGAMYVNEEGRNEELPINKIASHIWQAAFGSDAGDIRGDVVFFGGVNRKGFEAPIEDSFKKIIESVARNAQHW